MKPARTKKGQFPPGTSGNPKGRPKLELTALRERLTHELLSILLRALERRGGEMKRRDLDRLNGTMG